jgi:hypothetical protein
LSGLQDQVAAVLNSADPHHTYLPGGGSLLSYPRARQGHFLRDAAVGAALGLGAGYVFRRMRRRKAQKEEWTSPGFRALFLLLIFPVAGLALSMVWVSQSGRLLGWGAVLGVASFVAYAIFRAFGGGRFNRNRQGSPWRDDHKRGR